MSTFAELKSDVSKRLQDANNTSVSAADVGTAINRAVGYWKSTRFWFNEARSSGTLTAQSGTIPLPSDFLMPAYDNGAFMVEYSNIRYPMRKVNEPVYDGVWLGNGYGLPRWYARLAKTNEYQCYPMPDQDYTVLQVYLKDYPDLSADSDTNDFTNYAPDLIMYRACAKLSMDFRQDQKMYDAFMVAANDEKKNLLSLTNRDNASGGLTVASLLTDF